MIMKPRFLSTLLLSFTIGLAHADILETYSFGVSHAVPDNDVSGFSDTRIVSSAITNISSLIVTLNISGGYNGDLYCYLSHDGGLAVLLNRVGRSLSSPFGYGDSGFQVRLDDNAPNGDIHTYGSVLGLAAGSPLTGTGPFGYGDSGFQVRQNDNAPNGDIHTYGSGLSLASGSPLTGTWQVDGRNTSPALVLDTSPRNAESLLSQFQHLDAGGSWTLFVADLSPGAISTIDSWGLEVVAVPEPSMLFLLLSGGFVIVFSKAKHRAINPSTPVGESRK